MFRRPHKYEEEKGSQEKGTMQKQLDESVRNVGTEKTQEEQLGYLFDKGLCRYFIFSTTTFLFIIMKMQRRPIPTACVLTVLQIGVVSQI